MTYDAAERPQEARNVREMAELPSGNIGSRVCQPLVRGRQVLLEKAMLQSLARDGRRERDEATETEGETKTEGDAVTAETGGDKPRQRRKERL